MQVEGRPDRILVCALVAFASLLAPRCGSLATTTDHAGAGKASRETITICGAVDTAVRSDSAEGVSTLLTVIDARSGTRFIAEIPAAARPAFEASLGAAPEIAYQGTSLCVTGILLDEGSPSMIEVAKPEDVKVNSRAR